MGTFILNKYTISKFRLNPNDYNILIRITNPGEDFTKLEDESIYKDILELKFYDFTEEQNGLKIFSSEHLDVIMNFFEKHNKNCRNFVVHCDLGISRSAAVAVGWLTYNDDRASIYKIYHDKKHIPNKYIVTKFYKRMNKSMKYIEKWEREKFEQVEDAEPLEN